MQELFDPATRYIVYIAETAEPSANRVLGFASIRFDTEDTLDSQEYEDGVQTTVVYMWVSPLLAIVEANKRQLRDAGVPRRTSDRPRTTTLERLRNPGQRDGDAQDDAYMSQAERTGTGILPAERVRRAAVAGIPTD